MIKIYTDSTSYLQEHLIKDFNISILPLSVFINGENYLETEISNEKFFHLVDICDEFPKSSQPSTGYIEQLFRADVAQGNTIVGVFISSLMSGTFSAVNLVKNMMEEEYPDSKIHLIDSKSNCYQLGLAVLAGAQAAHDGLNVDEVIHAINETILRTRFIFIPYTLHYLEKGGRIGKASALLGNILHLIPILTVIDGETNSMQKVRTYKKAMKKLVAILLKDVEKLGISKIIVTHINAIEQANNLIDEIKKSLDIDVEISHIGPVIGAHVGPGSLGIIYKTKSPHALNMPK